MASHSNHFRELTTAKPRIFLDHKSLAAFQKQPDLSWTARHQRLAVPVEQKHPIGIFMLHFFSFSVMQETVIPAACPNQETHNLDLR